MRLERRRFLEAMTALGFGGTLFPGVLWARAVQESEITVETIARAEEVVGLSFTPEQRELMLEDLRERLEEFETLREVPLPNEVAPALLFDPALGGALPEAASRRAGRAGGDGRERRAAASEVALPELDRPARDEDLAFLSVPELAFLLRSGQVGSLELTRLYLARLKRHDPVLQAVVTLTEARALEQARRSDEELAAGRWRGPVHGIPWGAKDLLAVASHHLGRHALQGAGDRPHRGGGRPAGRGRGRARSQAHARRPRLG